VEDERLRVPRTGQMGDLGTLLAHRVKLLWLSGGQRSKSQKQCLRINE
jgi:hypothetical protein